MEQEKNESKEYLALIEAIDIVRGKHNGTVVAGEILEHLQKNGWMKELSPQKDNWKERFQNRFLDGSKKHWRKNWTVAHITSFIEDTFKRERKRDKINYILNKRTNFCNAIQPSQELLDELGIQPHDREAIILYILEKYFKEDEATRT